VTTTSGESTDPRHAVWIALSDLFLDTDVRLHYVYIVRILAAAPYSIEELARILNDEVTPVLQHNLMQVAGEWALFPDEWVIAEVSKRRDKRRWLPNVVNLREDWTILSIWIAKVRADASYLDALASLVPLFLSKNSAPCVRSEALATIYEHDLKPLLLPGCRKLHQESPTIYPSEEEIEANWQRLPI